MKRIALVRKDGNVDVYDEHHNNHWGHIRYTAVPGVDTIAARAESSPTMIRISMTLISLLLALVLLY